jgi:hypothetical protein
MNFAVEKRQEGREGRRKEREERKDYLPHSVLKILNLILVKPNKLPKCHHRVSPLP